jgi:PAS domain S-box-containing protein
MRNPGRSNRFSGNGESGRHKPAERALRDSEARLKAAADLLGFGLYTWNPQTNEFDWDARVKAMWGLNGDADVTYDTWRAAIHPDDLERVEAAVQRCVDTDGDGAYEIEYRVGGADGLERWVATRGKTSFEKGKAIGFLGVALDVTAHRRVESQLRRLNETLEQCVAERTLALEYANRRLVAEMQEHQRADAKLRDLQSDLSDAARVSAMGQMTATLAHELNQPLTAAGNFANAGYRRLGQANPDITAAREDVAEAAAQVLRAGQIIRRWRDFVGRGETQRSVESVPRIIEEAIQLAMTGSAGIAVHVDVRLEPAASHVFADRIQIQQVLVNLIRNALEAMTSSPQCELGFTSKTLGEEMIEIAVTDSGSGLSKPAKQRLFEPFASTKENGMGLGLSICRSIIEAHGGVLSTSPNPSGGTIFRFTLPTVPTNGELH